MSNASKSAQFSVNLGGPGLLLTLAFFFAKIHGYINWSWLWVFSPLWIPSALVLGFLGAIAVFAIFCGVVGLVCALFFNK